MPKVSVIIPVYNVEKYINECLDSLINQTLNDIEIIIIDDGSPDNCGKICDEYASRDNRIKVIHKKNGGVSAARNDGIKLAKSEWIMFVDSDDWVEESMCEVAYENVKKYNADIAIFNHYNSYENYEKINEGAPEELILDEYSQIEKLQMTILNYNYMRTLDSKVKAYLDMGAPWSKIFRREMLIRNNLEFPLHLKGLFDDVFFCLNTLEKAGKVVYKNIPLYHYRRLDNTLSNSFKQDYKERCAVILNEFELFIKNNNKENMMEAYYERVIIVLHRLLKLYFFNSLNDKKLSEKLKELKELINSYPYNHAIKNVRFKYLSKTQKVYAVLYKMKSTLLIWIFYKIKTVQTNRREKKC